MSSRPRRRTILRVLAVMMIVVVAAAPLLVRTAWFREALRDRLQTELEKIVRGEVYLGEINGNILSEVEISGITVVFSTDTVLHVPRLYASFALFPLLSQSVEVSSVELDGPQILIRQTADGAWAVSDLMVPSEGDTTGPSQWRVRIDSIQLREGSIRVITPDSSSPIPKDIRHLNLTSSLSIDSVGVNLSVHHLECEVRDRDTKIAHLSGSFRQNEAGTTIELGELRTGSNRLRGKANLKSSLPTIVEVSTGPLDFAEVRAFLPFLPLEAPLRVEARATIDGSIFDVIVSASDERQKLDVSARLEGLDSVPRYTIEAKMRNVDVRAFAGDSAPTTRLNGTAKVSGRGFDLAAMEADGVFHLVESVIQGRSFRDATFDGWIRHRSAGGTMNVTGDFGKASGTARVDGLPDGQAFDLDLHLDDFDAAPIALVPSLRSSVTADISAHGKGLELETMEASYAVRAMHSSAATVTIDSLYAVGGLNSGAVICDSLYVVTDSTQARGNGTVSLSGDLNVSFSALLGNAQVFRRWPGLESINGRGEVAGIVNRRKDELSGTASFLLHDLFYDSAQCRGATGSASFRLRGDSLLASGTVHADSVRYGGLSADSIGIEAVYDGKTIRGDVYALLPGPMDLMASASVETDSANTIVSIHALESTIARDRWRLDDDSAVICFGNSDYTVSVSGVRLISGDRLITVAGTTRGEADSGLVIHLRNLPLAAVGQVAGLRDTLGGALNLDAMIHGVPDARRFDAVIAIDTLSMNRGQLGNLRGTATHTDSALAWDITMKGVRGDTLHFDGVLHDYPTKERPSRLHVSTQHFSIGAFTQEFGQIDSLRGTVTGDLTFVHTGSEHSLLGFAAVTDGLLTIRKYGINYANISAKVRVEGDTLRLVSLFVSDKGGPGSPQEMPTVSDSGGFLPGLKLMKVPAPGESSHGYLSASGVLGVVDSLIKGSLVPVRLSAAARSFQAMKGRSAELNLDGDVVLARERNEIGIGGGIVINRSRWYIPALKNQAGSSGDGADPLLVKALQVADTAGRKKDDSVQVRLSTGVPVRGKVHVEIPRNTWLEAKGGQVELAGSIDIVGNGGDPEIFGTLETRRGNFTIFGFRFTVEKGKVMFQGGPEINPVLDLDVSYSFRTADKERKVLHTLIQGDTKKPDIRFTLDGRDLTREDAISYLLTGAPSSGLTEGQQNVADQADQMVENMTSSLISSRLSSTVGKQLGLDVIELRGSENWTKASLTAGKYVTDDVYVSYEKGFGQYSTNEVIPEVFTLEYELTRHLFFQIVGGNSTSSGFDILLKLQ